MIEQNKALINVQSICADEENQLMFRVKTKQAKECLINKCMELNQGLMQFAIQVFNENVTRISKEYQEICAKLNKIPKDEYELVEMKNFIQQIDINLASLKNDVLKTGKMMTVLNSFQAKLEFEEI